MTCALILDHAGVFAEIVTLDAESGMWGLCFENKMIVAVRAVFVALIKLLNVFAEALFALFASKDHFQGGL